MIYKDNKIDHTILIKISRDTQKEITRGEDVVVLSDFYIQP